MRLTNELVVGGAFGVAGLAIAAVTRRWNFDFGLIWGAMAVLALSLATRRWTGNLAGLTNPLFIVLAIIAVVAVTVTAERDIGVVRTPLPFLISLLGIYATVPDTESVLVLIGVSGPLAIAWRPLGWARPRWAGAAVMTAITALAVVSAGRGRESSIIGALAALAVIGLVACQGWPGPTAALLVHLGLVGWWSRVAGRADSGETALLVGLAMTVPVAALCWLLARRRLAATRRKAWPG